MYTTREILIYSEWLTQLTSDCEYARTLCSIAYSFAYEFVIINSPKHDTTIVHTYIYNFKNSNTQHHSKYIVCVAHCSRVWVRSFQLPSKLTAADASVDKIILYSPSCSQSQNGVCVVTIFSCTTISDVLIRYYQYGYFIYRTGVIYHDPVLHSE